MFSFFFGLIEFFPNYLLAMFFKRKKSSIFFQNCHDVRCMCASSDKNASWLYAGTFDDKLTIFDSKSHEVLMEWSDEPVQFKV